MAKKTTSGKTASAQGNDALTRARHRPKADLPVPIIKYAANNNLLYPIDAVNGTEAQLTLPAGATDAMFYMAIKDQGESEFDPVFVDDGDEVVPISAQVISQCIGHTVLIRYTATVGGLPKQSLVLELEVQQIREEDLKGSLPVFDHARYVHSTWQLDMKTFTGDETIKVKAWPMIQAGQRLFINVAGDQHRPPFAFVWVARDHVVTAAEAIAGHVFEFKLSRGWMARRQDYSALTIHIAVIFDGTAPKPAVPVDPIYETQLPENAHEFHPRTTALLFVDASLYLPAPTLVEAKGQSVADPLELLEGATIRVCYEDMRSTDSISLYWESTFGDCAPIAPQNGVEEGCVDFHVPPLYVGMRLDNFAHFSYTVTRDGKEYPSPEGVVRIPLPSNLPMPQILQAHDKVLDLSLLCCKDPVLYVAPWAFIDPTQRVDVYVSGIYADGSKARWNFFTDSSVTEEDVRNGWSRSLPRAELAKLKHGSELYLVFYVEFLPRKAGRPVYRMFPSLLLTILNEPHLELIPPHLVESVNDGTHGWVVNPVNTKDGAHIQVAYEQMCPGDRVCPTFTGTPGPGTPALECREVVEEGGPIEFLVPSSAISANFNQQILLDYRVTRCDGSEWTSPSRQVAVLGLSGLPKPAVEQATGNVLDLNTFSGDANAAVIPWDYIALNQPCWLWVTGKLEDGNPYSFNVLQGDPVTEEWLASGVNTPLPRHELQKLADCSDFEVHFAVNFNGRSEKASAKEFPVLTLVIAQEDLVLLAPTVREAVGSQLTVYNGRDGVTVRVAYELISPNHEISVCWKRADGTCLPLASKPGKSDPRYVDFHIPREAVIHGIGKIVMINYTVTSLCKVATSPDMGLHISVPVRLPTPVVPQATLGVLDLRTFTGDATITVEPWWFILPGQKVWLRGAGTKKDGSAYSINVYLGKAVTADEVSAGLKDILRRAELVLLKNDSLLIFTCNVTPNGCVHESDAVVFPVLVLTVKSEADVHYENFDGQPLRLISAGGVIVTPTMTITHISGPNQSGLVSFSEVSGMRRTPCLALCSGTDGIQSPPQCLQLKFGVPYRRLEFALTSLHGPINFHLYNNLGQFSKTITIEGDLSGKPIHYSVEAEGDGQSISRMDVITGDHCFLDYFRMWRWYE